jgi:methylmalonyl-CoA/ethylmalonyl-CoA epimerase
VSSQHGLQQRSISHISYNVPDIPSAVDYWVSTFGAGPFYLLPDMQFDESRHNGQDCVVRHSAAFGWWGSVGLELQQLHEASPPEVERLFAGPLNAVNHVAYFVPDPAAESARLEALGIPEFLFARIGPVEVTFHDAWSTLGHGIELHRETEFITGFFNSLRDAADGWDGSDPLRDMPNP